MIEFERIHGIPVGTKGSQGGEANIIRAYFGDRVGAYLDVGALDGVLCSNTYELAECGWSGVCVEPDPVALEALRKTHAGNDRISIVGAAVTDTDGTVKFHTSRGGGISTTSDAHLQKWNGATRFQTIEVPSVTVETLLKMHPGPFACLSLDVEGESVPLFEKFPLSDMGVELAVVEHDGLEDRVRAHAARHGLTQQIYWSAENCIVCK